MTKEEFALAAEGAGFRPTGTGWFYHPDTRGVLICHYDEHRMVVTFDITHMDAVVPISLQRLTYLFKAFQQ